MTYYPAPEVGPWEDTTSPGALGRTLQRWIATLPEEAQAILRLGPRADHPDECRVCDALDGVDTDTHVCACYLHYWHQEHGPYTETAYLRCMTIYYAAGYEG